MHESMLTEVIRLEESERNFEGAIALLKDLIRQDPTCVEAYVHLAADSGILRRFPQAEQYARIALNLDPLSGRARYYLACALRDQGRLDEAYPEMEQALVLVKKAAVKGTGAERHWERFPLFGWNRHVEEDAMDLRARMLRRSFEEYRKKMGLRLRMLGRRFWKDRKKKRDVLQFTSISGRMKTYRDERHDFEIDVPTEWLPPIRVGAEGLKFDCGSHEAFNIQIGSVILDSSLDDTESEFKRYAQAMGYTELVFGRITVQGKDHISARYRLGNRDRTKKYIIVLGTTEYAITATCFDPKKFTEKERAWDTIATSFHLLSRTADPTDTV